MSLALEITLLVVACLLVLVGYIGCVLPGIPGVPLTYAGLIVAQFSERVDFKWYTLVIFGLITVVATVLDYIVPAWGAKQFGGSKYGVWGSTLGLIIGLFFGFWGIILGPFIGAILLEMIGDKKRFKEAFKAGWGSIIGLVFGTIIKLTCCWMMMVALIVGIW